MLYMLYDACICLYVDVFADGVRGCLLLRLLLGERRGCLRGAACLRCVLLNFLLMNDDDDLCDDDDDDECVCVWVCYFSTHAAMLCVNPPSASFPMLSSLLGDDTPSLLLRCCGCLERRW